ncbi:MAG TPA: molybdopterin-dependent oxidoreductase [Longimicrobiales bacterium]|nr:molybdopterin-dependent oxidoreductase [Longimicrobiales bacterium]
MSETKTVNCTINGVAVSVPEGTRIIEAAEQAGLGIAHYCYHPALSAPAMCRMCLVEVQGAPKLQPACVTPVMDGNVILTESDKAREARQGTLEFYLLNHPLDCPICDKSGECKLQDYTHAEGRKHGRSLEPKRVLGRDDFGGDVLYDGNRCIMCTRCVRFMREIAGNDALCVVQRGDRSVIDTFFERGIEGDLWAGNIIDICPVGALLSKDFLHKARVWDLDGAPSVCPNCSQGCNVRIDTRDNLVMRLRPRANPEVNSYWMCDYGRYRYEWMNRGDRIEAPLMRDASGSLMASGWQQAITALVERVRSAGPGAGVKVITSPFHTVEDAGLAARFAAALGGGELVYRSERTADEVVCPGFPKLARRRDLAANTTGLDHLGYRRVGNDQGAGGVEGSARVLLVVGDELTDVPENSVSQASLFIYIGHTLTAAARAADFVLPASTFAEMEGTFVNFERRVQRFWPALLPPPLARPAWQILGVLLAGLDQEGAPASAAQAFALVASHNDAFAGLDYETLGPRGAVLNSRVRISADGGEVR